MQSIFEVTACGFTAETDETDDRVIWVAADSAAQVEAAIQDCDAIFCGELPPGHGVAEGCINFVLPIQALNLQEELLRWCGVERNKNRAA